MRNIVINFVVFISTLIITMLTCNDDKISDELFISICTIICVTALIIVGGLYLKELFELNSKEKKFLHIKISMRKKRLLR